MLITFVHRSIWKGARHLIIKVTIETLVDFLGRDDALKVYAHKAADFLAKLIHSFPNLDACIIKIPKTVDTKCAKLVDYLFQGLQWPGWTSHYVAILREQPETLAWASSEVYKERFDKLGLWNMEMEERARVAFKGVLSGDEVERWAEWERKDAREKERVRNLGNMRSRRR